MHKRTRLFLPLFIYLSLLFGVPTPGEAATTNLTCTAPTTRTDASALPASQIKGFNVYRASTAAGLAAAPILGTITGATCSYTDTTAPNALTFYAISAVDLANVESVKSNPVSLNLSAPSAPTNVVATVVTADNTVFKLRQGVDGFAMVAIGTGAIGTQCDAARTVSDSTGTYTVIPRSAVTLRSRFDTLPLIAFARCA